MIHKNDKTDQLQYYDVQYYNMYHIFQNFKIVIILIRRSRTHTAMLAYVPLLQGLLEDSILVPKHTGVDVRHKQCITQCVHWMTY
jgi:hypothetical protein